MNSLKSFLYMAFCTFTLSMTLNGCSANTSTEITSLGKGDSKKNNVTICTEPRPQICTREYKPVCAKLSDGSVKTYATGCTACSNPDIVSYVEGPCAKKE